MTPRAALPLLARLAVYYGALAGAALLLVRWLPAARGAVSLNRLGELSGATPAVAGPLGRPGAALTAAIAMVGALAVIVPVAWVYMRTKARARYDASLVHTVIVLPVAVAGIVLIVQDSLALAFSLAGVVAAVRFRNTLRDTRDAVYIFLAIGVGLAAGVQAFSVAFVMSVVYVAIVLVLWRFDVGAAPPVAERVRGRLVAETPNYVAAEPDIGDVLDEYARRWKLVGIEKAPSGRDVMTFDVRLRRRTTPEALVAAVRRDAAPHVATVRFEPDPQ